MASKSIPNKLRYILCDMTSHPHYLTFFLSANYFSEHHCRPSLRNEQWRMRETLFPHPVEFDDFRIDAGMRMPLWRETLTGPEDLHSRSGIGAARPGLPQHLGLYLRQPALHSQDVGLRRRRRLPGQFGRESKLHQADVLDGRVPVHVGPLHPQLVPLRLG